MIRANRAAVWLCLAWGTAAPLACAPEAPPANIGHYVSSRRDVLRAHQVVLVELVCDDNYPEIGEGMTQALFEAIQERRLFQVAVLGKADPRYAELVLPVRRPCQLKELLAMRKSLGCHAVLLGSISQFQPYPRMKIGLYLRLMDLRRGKLLWAVDHTWDTTNRDTELRMRDFFTESMRSGYDPVHWRIGMMSPRAFEKFVAHEAAGTLPPRTPPPPAVPPGPVEATLEKLAKIPKKISRAYEYHRE